MLLGYSPIVTRRTRGELFPSMALQRPLPLDNYSEESQAERLARKTRDAPYVPIGLAGCIGAVLYGIYQFKNKGEMSTSVYLMKFRVVAQSAVVVTLGIGVGYSMIDKYILPKFQTSASKGEEPSA